MRDAVIFDGHNDVLSQLYGTGAAGRRAFIEGNDKHIDLPKARIGGFGGGFFAIWVPSEMDADTMFKRMAAARYHIDVPPPVSVSDAMPIAMAQATHLLQLQRDGALKICTSVADIKGCLDSGLMAAILHVEGAEMIDHDFNNLHVLHASGLRSLGPVWSRHNDFAYGVPFAFPAGPDEGPGLTALGQDLVRECNMLKIMIDLSHLNEAGFWDVARISDAPLVATHSNVHALCASSRNLTDRQLAAIKESEGMVGLNFAVSFLRGDGQMLAETGLDVMLRHLDYLIEHLGEDRVGFGSDFDGAMVPEGIKNAAGLMPLREAMRSHGFNDRLMRKICHENWLRVLGKTWGAS